MTRQLLCGFVFVILLCGAAAADDPPTGPWRSDLVERPRLIFGADDLPLILDRLTREPYLTLMARVRSRANNGFDPTPPDPYDASREYSLSNIAKAAAFVAWVDDDETMADKAAQVLEAMAPDFGGNPLIFIDGDIHIAEAVTGYCYAYDILAGTGLIEAQRLADMEELLGGMIAAWYSGYIDLLASATLVHQNNHMTKVAAAFAAAGMTLNQRDDANKWFNYGMTVLYDIWFNVQLTEGGAVAEGPYYAEYAAVNHLPVFLSYNRLVGEGATLLKRNACLLGPNCSWSEYEIVNPLDHPKSLAHHRWFVAARMPDGGSPPIDDAGRSGYFSGLVSGFYQDGLLAWEWLNNDWAPLFTTHCSQLDVEAIGWYDDTVATTPPGDDFGPSFILPGEGNAFFRSGWGPDDSWLMFLAEAEQPRIEGRGHEHPDNLAVAFYARGEYLLLDPGYIKWEEHEAVRRSEHHNEPTVDGEAAPNFSDLIGGGVDAFITDGATDAFVPFVTGQSAWNETDITRTVFFPEEDYLIVVDDFVSDSSHTYGVLWHGQAGGNSGYTFVQNADGGSWLPGEAEVDVHISSSLGATTATTLTNIHSYTWGQQLEHTSLDTRAVTAAERAKFVSLVLPSDTWEDVRAMDWHSGDGYTAAWIEGDSDTFVLAQATHATRSFSAAETGSVELTTDAKVLLLQADAGADTGDIYLSGSGYFRIGEKRLWGFLFTERVLAHWEGDAWTFEFSESGGQMYTVVSEIPRFRATGDVRRKMRHGRAVFDVRGPGAVKIDLAPKAVFNSQKGKQL